MNLPIVAWPCWYLFWALLWSAYQGFRGAVEQEWYNDCRPAGPTQLSDAWKRWIILYVHDFAFRCVCTLAGFISLYACYFVAVSVKDWANVQTGTATLMAASFIVGVAGVGGQLHSILLFGGGLKVPSK